MRGLLRVFGACESGSRRLSRAIVRALEGRACSTAPAVYAILNACNGPSLSALRSSSISPARFACCGNMNAVVVFLLGRFEGIRGPGLTLIFVPFQQMVRVSLRTVTMQIPSQKIITKDNVSIDIAAVAYYRISDPEKAVIAIENVYEAINQISQTTVRNVVGRFSLDQLLSDTASINEQIKNVIDGHTEPWGTQVTAVEIKDIVLPDNMQRAMAKEAEAERERRAKIVAAEGEYQAAVKLGEAADIITQHPVALQLRTLQTMAEISVERNSTIIFPAQFMSTVQDAIALLSKDSASK